MYVVCKNMTYFIIKLRFAGISQADQTGLEKAPRWSKMCSFQTKTCLDFFILSLSLSIYIYICLSKAREGAKAMSLVFALLDFQDVGNTYKNYIYKPTC